MSAALDPQPPLAAPAASASPVVVLDGVFARDAAGPRGSARGALLGATASLGPGVHAFLGAPEDGTIALCDTLAGVRRPLRGAVLLAGEDPSISPSARARTGALLAAPELPEARTVRGAIEQALLALGRAPAGADGVLAELGLGLLAARALAALSYAEARAVELALALAVVKHASPGVLVLFEPCADVAVPSGARAIDDRVAEARASGAVVVLATSSPADARRLADEIHVLHRGVVIRHERMAGGARHPAIAPALAPGAAEISVTVAAGASVRALAAALAEHPAVHAALWEHPPLAAGRPPVLRVRGPDREACALAVIDAAVNTGVALEAITSSIPDLPAIQSAAVAAVQRALAHRPRPGPGALSAAAAPAGAAPPTGTLAATAAAGMVSQTEASVTATSSTGTLAAAAATGMVSATEVPATTAPPAAGSTPDHTPRGGAP